MIKETATQTRSSFLCLVGNKEIYKIQMSRIVTSSLTALVDVDVHAIHFAKGRFPFLNCVPSSQ